MTSRPTRSAHLPSPWLALLLTLALAGCPPPGIGRGGGGKDGGGGGADGGGRGTDGGGGTDGGSPQYLGREMHSGFVLVDDVATGGAAVYALYGGGSGGIYLGVQSGPGAQPSEHKLAGCLLGSQLGVDAAGDAFATCSTGSATQGQQNLLFRYDAATSTLGSGEPVPSPSTTGDDGAPGLYVDAAGDAWVAYEHAGAQAFAVERHAGGSWDTPIRIDGASSSAGTDVVVAGDPAGGAVALWANVALGPVYAARLTASGWQTPVKIADVSGDTGGLLAAMNPSGAIAVVDAHDNQVDGIRYDPSSGWSTPSQIDAGHGSIGNVFPPAIATDGEILTVWTEGSGSQHAWLSRYQPGTGYAGAKQVDSGSDTGFASVAYSSTGVGAVAWDQTPTGALSPVIAVETAAANASFASPRVLDNVPPAVSDEVRVVFAGTDKPVLVWSADAISGGGVYLYRLP